MNEKIIIYHVKDLDCGSVMKLNQIQLDDMIQRIQLYFPDREGVFEGRDACLLARNFKVIHVETRD